MRGWMNDVPSYLPPVGIGEVMRSAGSGVVVESMLHALQRGRRRLRPHRVAGVGPRRRREPLRRGAANLGLDLAAYMNILGATGMTAYFGLLDVGRFQSGDVVVVSGAAGATGSVVGQIARARGAAKVVGIAGGAEKCSYVDRAARLRRVPRLPRGASGATTARRRAPGAWTSTSTTSVAPYSTLPWPTSRCAVGSSRAGRSRPYNDCDALHGRLQHVGADPAARVDTGLHRVRFRRALRRGARAAGGDDAPRRAGSRRVPRGGTRERPGALKGLFSGANLGKTLVVVDPGDHPRRPVAAGGRDPRVSSTSA